MKNIIIKKNSKYNNINNYIWELNNFFQLYQNNLML